MIQHPRTVWLSFAVFVGLALTGLGWLTWETVDIDHAQARVRRQVERDERIRLALWRIDALLMPLLVEEASRPAYFYDATYTISASMSSSVPSSVTADKTSGSARQRVLSPLLATPSEFTQLYFEWSADGECSSPQVPSATELKWAFQQGVTRTQVEAAAAKVERLRALTRFEPLWDQLPEVTSELPAALAAIESDLGLANVNRVNGVPQVVESFAQQRTARGTAPYYNGQGVGQGIQSPSGSGPSSNSGPGNAYANSAGNSQSISPSNQAGNSVGNSLANPPSNDAPFSNSPFNKAPIGNALNPANSSLPPPPTPPSPAQQVALPQGDAARLDQRLQQDNDLSSRANVFQALASKSANRDSGIGASAPRLASTAIEGMSRPLWIGSELLLARRVERDERFYVQGCWLDWAKLRQRMRQEIVDVLPEVEFHAARVDEVANTLATLPIRIDVPDEPTSQRMSTSVRWALGLAWCGFGAAVIGAVVTIRGILALSERRAAFVAAVTHELRTPLTTFRMYAEMLAGGMVPAESRARYLETLRVEADRLAHLVDNVLQYARLERGRPRVTRETLAVRALVERISPRMASRAQEVGLPMEMTIEKGIDERLATLDVGACEQILFNLVDNACKYASAGERARLRVTFVAAANDLICRVEDNGPGLPGGQLSRLFEPFSKTVQEAAVSAPGVGLGLALCRRLAREMGGELRLDQSAASGATFVLTLKRALS